MSGTVCFSRFQVGPVVKVVYKDKVLGTSLFRLSILYYEIKKGWKGDIQNLEAKLNLI